MKEEEKFKLHGKIEARVKKRDKLSAEIQADIDTLAGKIENLLAEDLKTYAMLVKPDSLFNDSPISKFWTCEWIRQYMIRKDLDFVGHFFDGKINIKTISERSVDASKWALRFTKEAEPEKTGIEAVL